MASEICLSGLLGVNTSQSLLKADFATEDTGKCESSCFRAYLVKKNMNLLTFPDVGTFLVKIV